jgi:hypothetical protein
MVQSHLAKNIVSKTLSWNFVQMIWARPQNWYKDYSKTVINSSKTTAKLFYLETQSILRSKHFSTRL